jgi:hypothetical protein
VTFERDDEVGEALLRQRLRETSFRESHADLRPDERKNFSLCLESISALQPTFSQEWNSHRRDLFVYQESRRSSEVEP